MYYKRGYFLSIMIEALPFVLIGSLISGWIEVYITPDKVYEFLPRNRWGESFWYLHWLPSFHPADMWNRSDYQSFFWKKVPSYTAVPFLVTAPIINPIVLFATYSAFGNSIKLAFLRALGSHCDCFGAWDFPRIFLEGNPFKRESLLLVMNMTFHT